jgi:hypothetical protein
MPEKPKIKRNLLFASGDRRKNKKGIFPAWL